MSNSCREFPFPRPMALGLQLVVGYGNHEPMAASAADLMEVLMIL